MFVERVNEGWLDKADEARQKNTGTKDLIRHFELMRGETLNPRPSTQDTINAEKKASVSLKQQAAPRSQEDRLECIAKRRMEIMQTVIESKAVSKLSRQNSLCNEGSPRISRARARTYSGTSLNGRRSHSGAGRRSRSRRKYRTRENAEHDGAEAGTKSLDDKSDQVDEADLELPSRATCSSSGTAVADELSSALNELSRQKKELSNLKDSLMKQYHHLMVEKQAVSKLLRELTNATASPSTAVLVEGIAVLQQEHVQCVQQALELQQLKDENVELKTELKNLKQQMTAS